MAIINTTQIKDLLRPGLAGILTQSKQAPKVYSQVFTERKSDKQFELEVEVSALPLAQLKTEGASIAYRDMEETFVTTYLNRAYAIGYIITREAIQDNLYKKDFPMQTESLTNSLLQLREQNGASIFNNGFNSSYPIGDGQALFSTAHPLGGSGTTQSNTFATAVGLNESSLQDAIVTVQKFREASGLFATVQPTKLHVPSELQFQADRLLGSQYRTGTADNDISALYNIGSVPNGYVSNRYLTSSTAWFLLSDAQMGFTFFNREATELDIFEDFDTKSLKVSGFERYSFGVTNFRAAVGSQGAA